MSEKPKRKRCPNGLRKNKKTGICEIKDKKPTIDTVNKVDNKKYDPKKNLKPAPKKRMIKIKKDKEPPKRQARQGGPERSKNGKTIRIIKKKKEKPAPPPEPKPEPPKQTSNRRRRARPKKPQAPIIRNPVKEISERIIRLGKDTAGFLPKETIRFISTNLYKIIDSDLPYNINGLRIRFQKEVKESIQNLRKERTKLGKVEYLSKEADKYDDFKNQLALLRAVNALLNTFDTSNQSMRDRDFNYYIEAKKLDFNKVARTVTYLNKLKDVDDFETDKRFNKPTDKQKEQNKKNMKILKDGLKDDLYGVQYGAIFLTQEPKSKTWRNAYEKLFNTKNKFKLNATFLYDSYPEALKRLKKTLGVKWGEDELEDAMDNFEPDDLEE